MAGWQILKFMPLSMPTIRKIEDSHQTPQGSKSRSVQLSMACPKSDNAGSGLFQQRNTHPKINPRVNFAMYEWIRALWAFACWKAWNSESCSGFCCRCLFGTTQPRHFRLNRQIVERASDRFEEDTIQEMTDIISQMPKSKETVDELWKPHLSTRKPKNTQQQTST